MRTISEIVVHTPLWVWAVFALVIGLGVMRARDRNTSVAGLLVLPAIMAAYSISGLVHTSLGTLPAALIGMAIGSAAGWLMEGEGATTRLPDGRIRVRGEWSSLALVLAIFAFRYTAGVLAATSPATVASTGWQILAAFVSGFFAALFVARTAARLRTYLDEAPKVAA